MSGVGVTLLSVHPSSPPFLRKKKAIEPRVVHPGETNKGHGMFRDDLEATDPK